MMAQHNGPKTRLACTAESSEQQERAGTARRAPLRGHDASRAECRLACAGLSRAGEAAGKRQHERETHDAEDDVGHDARKSADRIVRRHVVHGLGERRYDRVACGIQWDGWLSCYLHGTVIVMQGGRQQMVQGM